MFKNMIDWKLYLSGTPFSIRSCDEDSQKSRSSYSLSYLWEGDRICSIYLTIRSFLYRNRSVSGPCGLFIRLFGVGPSGVVLLVIRALFTWSVPLPLLWLRIWLGIWPMLEILWMSFLIGAPHPVWTSSVCAEDGGSCLTWLVVLLFR